MGGVQGRFGGDWECQEELGEPRGVWMEPGGGQRPTGLLRREGAEAWPEGAPGDLGGSWASVPGVGPSPPACPPPLSARCLHFSCLFPSPCPVSSWPANFNLKLDWADLMQIPPGKTLKLMNSYVKSILHHREKVTSARKKNNKVKETRAFHV